MICGCSPRRRLWRRAGACGATGARAPARPAGLLRPPTRGCALGDELAISLLPTDPVRPSALRGADSSPACEWSVIRILTAPSCVRPHGQQACRARKRQIGDFDTPRAQAYVAAFMKGPHDHRAPAAGATGSLLRCLRSGRGARRALAGAVLSASVPALASAAAGDWAWEANAPSCCTAPPQPTWPYATCAAKAAAGYNSSTACSAALPERAACGLGTTHACGLGLACVAKSPLYASVRFFCKPWNSPAPDAASVESFRSYIAHTIRRRGRGGGDHLHKQGSRYRGCQWRWVCPSQ